MRLSQGKMKEAQTTSVRNEKADIITVSVINIKRGYCKYPLNLNTQIEKSRFLKNRTYQPDKKCIVP